MEKNYEMYRDSEAGKLRQIKRIDPTAARAYLERLKDTDQYQEAESAHRLARTEAKQEESENEATLLSTKERIEADMPEGFEINMLPGGSMEITLENQDNFEGWDQILSILKAQGARIEEVKLYDFEGSDTKFISIKNPRIMIPEAGEVNAMLTFDKANIDNKELESLGKNEQLVVGYVLGLLNTRIILHKGMIRSVVATE